ncbi:hypothetical protein IW261DRAFT_1429438 [Armillaria novae-zelandiae]|uniref:Uncharacterized protein n=1 Tax=Armillaria novae-zelandiae TaxID=153914 RepID=A0AA39KF64_9AGAR|nr:hypothetical protein IW261DRAFT_1429438 [Armillaria novae-zelandiae]
MGKKRLSAPHLCTCVSHGCKDYVDPVTGLKGRPSTAQTIRVHLKRDSVKALRMLLQSMVMERTAEWQRQEDETVELLSQMMLDAPSLLLPSSCSLSPTARDEKREIMQRFEAYRQQYYTLARKLDLLRGQRQYRVLKDSIAHLALELDTCHSHLSEFQRNYGNVFEALQQMKTLHTQSINTFNSDHHHIPLFDGAGKPIVMIAGYIVVVCSIILMFPH